MIEKMRCPPSARRTLGLLLLLLAPLCKPSAPVQSTEWRRIYSADGAEVFMLRKPGRAHLLVYVGFQPGALGELEQARSAVLKAGYNLLTFTLEERREPAPEPDAGAETGRRRAAVQEFVHFASQLPGYEKKILVAPGADLPDLLPLKDGWSALVVLRPGDAPVRDKQFQSRLGEFSTKLDLAWVSSGREPERSRAARLAASVGATRPRKIVDTSLPGPGTQNFTLNLPPGSDLENFLLLHNLKIVWRAAGEVFAKGCSLRPDGGRPIPLDKYRVSAAADRDVCPLFLRAEDDYFRAGNVSTEGCVYPLAYYGRTLYCLN